VILRLQPRPPYDFALTAGASPYYTTLHRLHDGALWRLLPQDTTHCIMRVESVGSIDTPLLEAQVVYQDGTLDAARLEAQLGHWLALDADLTRFYAVAQEDAVLAETAARLRGLHILRTGSVFEALVVTMIEQQIALRAAQKAERWLVATYGDAVEYDGVRYYDFPTPARLATLTTDDLIPLKITFIRMNRILSIARQVVAGGLDLEALRDAPYEVAYRALMALDGIGHWTAAWTLTRAVGAYTYVGSADVALRAAVNHYWRGQAGRAERGETDALFARYGAVAGAASVYTLMRWGMERYPLIR
jgi:DNA-3-methyladenine glycosylase II